MVHRLLEKGKKANQKFTVLFMPFESNRSVKIDIDKELVEDLRSALFISKTLLIIRRSKICVGEPFFEGGVVAELLE